MMDLPNNCACCNWERFFAITIKVPKIAPLHHISANSQGCSDSKANRINQTAPKKRGEKLYWAERGIHDLNSLCVVGPSTSCPEKAQDNIKSSVRATRQPIIILKAVSSNILKRKQDIQFCQNGELSWDSGILRSLIAIFKVWAEVG